jgi:nucleoside-diphosphate-sugar epimerase
MTWDEKRGGAIGAFLDAARSGRPPVVSGELETSWPVIHRDDLAQIYCTVLEAGEPGRDYHGVAQEGVPVGEIAIAIANRYGAPAPVRETVAQTITRQGEWARGYSLGQRMGAPFTRDSLGWRPCQTNILAQLSTMDR